jgi:hypothetical protein
MTAGVDPVRIIANCPPHESFPMSGRSANAFAATGIVLGQVVRPHDGGPGSPGR